MQIGENIENGYSNVRAPHILGGGTEQRLLDRGWHQIDDWYLRLEDEADDGFRESTHHDVYDSFLKSGKVVSVDNVGDDDSQDSSGKSTQDGEEINPGGGAFLDSDILTNRVEGGAANTF